MLTLTANSLEFPTLSSAPGARSRRRHPNRLPFRGVLTLLDVASDRAPAGARGHRVLVPRAAAEHALPTLVGMALDYTPALDGHDSRRKIGVITTAEIKPVSRAGGASPSSLAGGRPLTTAAISISGYIFARDFPDVVRELRAAGIALATAPQLAASAAAPTSDSDDPMPRASSCDLPLSKLSFSASAACQPPTAGSPGPWPLGLSYEIAEVEIESFSAPIWIVKEMIFTGAAVLRRDKAAYRNTWIKVD
jgi:hypothetical protein